MAGFGGSIINISSIAGKQVVAQTMQCIAQQIWHEWPDTIIGKRAGSAWY